MISIDLKGHKTTTSAISNENISYFPSKPKANKLKEKQSKSLRKTIPQFLSEQKYQTIIEMNEGEDLDLVSTFDLEEEESYERDKFLNVHVLPPKRRKKVNVHIIWKSRAEPKLYEDEWKYLQSN